MTLKLGLLETGRPPEELEGKHPNYPQMMVNWLKIPDAESKSFAVLDGELPESPDDADIWVITGSKFGAYEDHPWIPPLEDFIRSCRDANVPMVGICFGHQIIAQALGGVVRKSAKGWGLGVHDYQVVKWPEALGKAPEGVHIQAVHQDQVEELPVGAERIATSEFCENAALWYPGFAVTFQGHPEFHPDFIEDLLEARRGTAFPESDVHAALDTMEKPNNQKDLGRAIRDWIAHRQAMEGAK